jgi:hypothetical protein
VLWNSTTDSTNADSGALGRRLLDGRFGFGGVSAAVAHRISADGNMAQIGLPAVSGGTASLNLPAQSLTTYVFRAGTTPSATTP